MNLLGKICTICPLFTQACLFFLADFCNILAPILDLILKMIEHQSSPNWYLRQGCGSGLGCFSRIGSTFGFFLMVVSVLFQGRIRIRLNSTRTRHPALTYHDNILTLNRQKKLRMDFIRSKLGRIRFFCYGRKRIRFFPEGRIRYVSTTLGSATLFY